MAFTSSARRRSSRKTPRPPASASALELLSALYSVHPAFGEARILELVTQCRPTLPDNLPEIRWDGGRLIQINGLYRHGYLIAPAVLDAALVLIEQLTASSPPALAEVAPTPVLGSALSFSGDGLMAMQITINQQPFNLPRRRHAGRGAGRLRCEAALCRGGQPQLRPSPGLFGNGAERMAMPWRSSSRSREVERCCALNHPTGFPPAKWLCRNRLP